MSPGGPLNGASPPQSTGAALLAEDLAPEKALELLEAHEIYIRNAALDTAVDRFNNNTGIEIGTMARVEGWSEEELLNAVIEALEGGQLACAVDGEVGRC